MRPLLGVIHNIKIQTPCFREKDRFWVMCRSRLLNHQSSFSAISGSLHPSYSLRRGPSSFVRNGGSFSVSRDKIPSQGSAPSFQSIEENRDLEISKQSMRIVASVNARLYNHSKNGDGHGEWKRLTISNFTELYYNSLTGVISTTIPDGYMVGSTTQAFVPQGTKAKDLAILINAAYAQVRRSYAGPRSTSLHSMDSSTRHTRSSSSYTSLPSSFLPRMSRQSSFLSRSESIGYKEARAGSPILMQLREMLFDGRK